MVDASRSLVCVFVDCDWGKKNRDLSEEYGVRGYPTVIFCDPEGKALEKLGARDPASVAAQIRKIAAAAAAGPAPPPMPEFALGAVGYARQKAKPLMIYFYDDSPASISVHQSIMDPILRPALQRLVAAKTAYRRGEGFSARFDVTRAPTILVLDAALEKPEAKPLARIEGSRSARELLRELEAVLGGASAPAAEGPAAERRPLVTKEDEALSDDEVDRQFIQAQMVVAREWLRKERKPKAIEVLKDIIKSYPKHVATAEARKLLETIQN